MADELHPCCVHATENMDAAKAVADLLTDKGFPAAVWLPDVVASTGDSLGLSPETVKGYEVRVLKEAHAEPAREMLADLKEDVRERLEKEKQRAERTGTVSAVCEECGKSSDWPASAMGTTESCPHCDAYMDIPDPDDDWGDVDFGEDEDDTDE